MNEQEITAFTDLYIKFQERCGHVAEILSEYDRDFKETRWNNWELDYADCHAENKFDCFTEVDIIVYGCLVDTRNLHFPIELLSENDEQIHLYAQKKYKKSDSSGSYRKDLEDFNKDDVKVTGNTVIINISNK